MIYVSNYVCCKHFCSATLFLSRKLLRCCICFTHSADTISLSSATDDACEGAKPLGPWGALLDVDDTGEDEVRMRRRRKKTERININSEFAFWRCVFSQPRAADVGQGLGRRAAGRRAGDAGASGWRRRRAGLTCPCRPCPSLCPCRPCPSLCPCPCPCPRVVTDSTPNAPALRPGPRPTANR